MPNEPTLKPMMTVKDVARLLNIHINTVRRWSNQGILKAYRITQRGDRRYRQEDIARFLAEYNDFNASKSSVREHSGT
ncbi:MAG: helix-turn-helix domain-containing protein [Dehalococcoidales bacterium]|nr:helix-turn-helix domain-containing protein [Dehalococcoidales bacterium]